MRISPGKYFLVHGGVCNAKTASQQPLHIDDYGRIYLLINCLKLNTSLYRPVPYAGTYCSRTQTYLYHRCLKKRYYYRTLVDKVLLCEPPCIVVWLVLQVSYLSTLHNLCITLVFLVFCLSFFGVPLLYLGGLGLEHCNIDLPWGEL